MDLIYRGGHKKLMSQMFSLNILYDVQTTSHISQNLTPLSNDTAVYSFFQVSNNPSL